MYYVLGINAQGQPIAQPEEIPSECGVIVARGTGLEVVRVAPALPFGGMRLDTWMALAKSAPVVGSEEVIQLEF